MSQLPAKLLIDRNHQKANFRSLKYPHNKCSHPISMELTWFHCCSVISIETRRRKKNLSPHLRRQHGSRAAVDSFCRSNEFAVQQKVIFSALEIENTFRWWEKTLQACEIFKNHAAKQITAKIFQEFLPSNGFNHKCNWWINIVTWRGMAKWNAQIICFLFSSLLFSCSEHGRFAVKLNVFSKNASIYAYIFFLTFVFLLLSINALQ